MYVFGETIVFSDLSSARDQIGIKRAVTLEGELLEKSGAMTGGSLNNRALGLSFGRVKDNDDCDLLKNRLLEIGWQLAAKCNMISKFMDQKALFFLAKRD